MVNLGKKKCAYQKTHPLLYVPFLKPVTKSGTLFVVVMPVCGEHEHNDFRIVDFIYQPMFFGDPSAPLSAAVSF